MTELPPDAAAPETRGAGTMTLFGHLNELRRRLTWIAVGIAVAFGLCAWQTDRLVGWLVAPYAKETGQPLAVFELTEAFFLKLRVSFLAALFFSMPWTLVQVWRFVSPALYPRERRWAAPFIVGASLLFLAGGAFAYYIGLPFLLDFLVGVSAQEFEKAIRAETYVTFVGRMMLGMGAVFEAPAVALVLTRMGLLTPGFLVRYWRHALVGIFVASAFVTPSGDIPTMVLFASPMTVLYLLCILVSWVFRPASAGTRTPA